MARHLRAILLLTALAVSLWSLWPASLATHAQEEQSDSCAVGEDGDRWEPMSVVGAPGPRGFNVAVWTGSQMLIWGGSELDEALGDGARYDPASDTWTPMSSQGAPSPRYKPAAVWTGEQLLVWGGYSGPSGLRADGSAYSPSTDTWESVSPARAPAAMRPMGAAWTGSEMLVVGVRDDDRALVGAAYNPTTKAWRTLNAQGAPSARTIPAVFWTGTLLLVWGGNAWFGSAQLTDGAAYDPTTDTWRALADPAQSTTLLPNPAAWTGRRLLIWGAQYDPSADRWERASVTAEADPNTSGAVWTGCEMLAWGTFGRPGAHYDPVSNTWTPLAPDDQPTGRLWPSLVWDRHEMLVWGGFFDGIGKAGINSGGRYIPPRELAR